MLTRSVKLVSCAASKQSAKLFDVVPGNSTDNLGESLGLLLTRKSRILCRRMFADNRPRLFSFAESCNADPKYPAVKSSACQQVGPMGVLHRTRIGTNAKHHRGGCGRDSLSHLRADFLNPGNVKLRPGGHEVTENLHRHSMTQNSQGARCPNVA